MTMSRCIKTIQDDTMRGHQCTHEAVKYQLFCRQHLPADVQARRDQDQSAYDEKCKAIRLQHERAAMFPGLLRALVCIQNADEHGGLQQAIDDSTSVTKRAQGISNE